VRPNVRMAAAVRGRLPGVGGTGGPSQDRHVIWYRCAWSASRHIVVGAAVGGVATDRDEYSSVSIALIRQLDRAYSIYPSTFNLARISASSVEVRSSLAGSNP